MKTVGLRIKHVRALLGLSQEAFAKMLSSNARRRTVTRGAVGNWERDEGIKTENLMLVADQTGVQVEWLARRVGPDPKEKTDLIQKGNQVSSVDNFNLKLGVPSTSERWPTDPIQAQESEDFINIKHLINRLNEEELRRAKIILFATFPESAQDLISPENHRGPNAGRGLT